jgi:hypothetical protein
MSLLVFYFKCLFPMIASAFTLHLLGDYSPNFHIATYTESWYIFWAVLSLLYGRIIDIFIDGWLEI